MNFLDFVFYRTYKQYIRWGESDIPAVYALSVITLFPCLNITSVIFFVIDVFGIKSWNYNVWAILFFFGSVLLLNYYRVYKKIGLLNLIKRWDETGDRKKRRLTGWMFAYIIMSLIVLFVSIIY